MRLRVNFHGRVQGVGFRATARDIATDAGVSGWVRNEADGSVMMQVQGEESAVADTVLLIIERMGHHVRSHNEARIAEVPGEAGMRIER